MCWPDAYQRNAVWLGFLMVPSTPAELVTVNNDSAPWLAQLPLAMQNPGKAHAPSLSRKDAFPLVLFWWPLQCASGVMEGISAPGVLVLDDLADQTEQKAHVVWRQWLQLFNAVQVLPGMLMTTIAGIQAGDLDAVTLVGNAASTSAATSNHAALSQEWFDAIGMTLEPLRAGLKELAVLGAPLPEIGHELADERGVVVADSEMAWTKEHVVLLTNAQLDMEDAWKASGWTALVLNDGNVAVDGRPWTEAIGIVLGITKSNEGVSA